MEAVSRYPDLEELIGIVPDTSEGIMSLAAVLAADRPGDAATLLRRSWEELGTSLRSGGSASHARTWRRGGCRGALRAVSAKQPGDSSGFLTGAAALEELAKPDDAQRLLEEGARRIPGSPQILQRLAQRALARRMYSEARQLVEAIGTRTASEVAEKHVSIARILWAQRRYAEAIQEVRIAVTIVPNDPGPRIALSEYAASVGRLDEAISALEGAAALPTTTEGKYSKRLSELRAARQEQIDARYRRGLGLDGPALR